MVNQTKACLLGGTQTSKQGATIVQRLYWFLYSSSYKVNKNPEEGTPLSVCSPLLATLYLEKNTWCRRGNHFICHHKRRRGLRLLKEYLEIHLVPSPPPHPQPTLHPTPLRALYFSLWFQDLLFVCTFNPLNKNSTALKWQKWCLMALWGLLISLQIQRAETRTST